MNEEPTNDAKDRELLPGEKRDPKGKTEGAIFGTAGGAILGGAVGSIVGPGGTVVGALGGAAAGAAIGLAVGAGGTPDPVPVEEPDDE